MAISPTLAEMQHRGFPLGGESSVAVDLIDTVANLRTSPTDLLIDNADAWWALEASRLPYAPTPQSAATDRLRGALREIIEAAIDDRQPRRGAVDDLNRFAESALSSPRLEFEDARPLVATEWHVTRSGNSRIAAIARDGIALVGDPSRRSLLRRCANPTCSMIFVGENPRRVWCASNVCGNRARVARHQQKSK